MIAVMLVFVYCTGCLLFCHCDPDRLHSDVPAFRPPNSDQNKDTKNL